MYRYGRQYRDRIPLLNPKTAHMGTSDRGCARMCFRMQRLTKLVLVLLVGLCLFLPLIEHVDFWDNWPATGNDLELNELSVLLVFGLALAMRLVSAVLSTVIAAVCNAVAALTLVPQALVLPRPRFIRTNQAFSPPLSSLRI